jgi:hypothetical protein
MYADETGIGVGMVLTVLWENSGPTNPHIQVRVLEINWHVCSPLTGGQGEGADPQTMRIVTRDYNPFRVQCTLALLGGAGREVMLECGSIVEERKWFHNESRQVWDSHAKHGRNVRDSFYV